MKRLFRFSVIMDFQETNRRRVSSVRFGPLSGVPKTNAIAKTPRRWSLKARIPGVNRTFA